MNWIKDFLYINGLSMKRSAKAFLKNPVLLLLGFIYGSISLAATLIFSGIPLLGGFVLYMVEAGLMAHYFYMLHEIIKGVGKCHIRSVRPALRMYFLKVYGVLFFIFLVQFVSSSLFMGNITLTLIVFVFLILLLNALPETLYQRHYGAVESIKYAFRFVKGFYIEWFLPNLLFFGILFLMDRGNFGISIFNFMPRAVFVPDFWGILFYLLKQMVFMYIMLYRGMLFDILSTTSKHKRMYERKMKNAEM